MNFVQFKCLLLFGCLFLPSANSFFPSAITKSLSNSVTPFNPINKKLVDVIGATGSAKNEIYPNEPSRVCVAPETMKASLELLKNAGQSFNSSSATELILTVTKMRQNNTDELDIANYLNGLLKQGPDSNLPFWARIRPLTRVSGRARLYSLRRTLDYSTPPPNAEDEDKEDSVEDQMRRRRRALLSLLRQLQSNPAETGEQVKGTAIRYLEGKAMSEHKFKRKRTMSNDDMMARRPQDLETPQYRVVTKRPSTGIEIRHYEPFTVCSVAMGEPRPVDSYKTDATVSDPSMANARAFGALAGYLFGKNQNEQAMKMTTPVLTRPSTTLTVDKDDGRKFMSFVLPSDYWKDGLTQAPLPMQGSGVILEEEKGGDKAVLMFGGYASRKEAKEQKQRLLKGLAKDSEWEAVPGEQIVLAQYNDPFTVPWKRLNEVSVAVKKR